MNEYATATHLGTARETETGQELNRLQDVCDQLDKLSQELENRLSQSILATRRPEIAESDIAKGQPEPIRVPLADTLHDKVGHLQTVKDRLSSMLNRLEA